MAGKWIHSFRLYIARTHVSKWNPGKKATICGEWNFNLVLAFRDFVDFVEFVDLGAGWSAFG